MKKSIVLGLTALFISGAVLAKEPLFTKERTHLVFKGCKDNLFTGLGSDNVTKVDICELDKDNIILIASTRPTGIVKLHSKARKKDVTYTSTVENRLYNSMSGKKMQRIEQAKITLPYKNGEFYILARGDGRNYTMASLLVQLPNKYVMDDIVDLPRNVKLQSKGVFNNYGIPGAK